jgi:hypothetical protein
MATYNPLTDTWRLLEKTGHEEQVINQSLLWTGAELILWGGRYRETYFNTGASYKLTPVHP